MAVFAVFRKVWGSFLCLVAVFSPLCFVKDYVIKAYGKVEV